MPGRGVHGGTVNAVEPSADQLAALVARAGETPNEPIVMLNLNRYRDRSQYERYGEVALEVLAKVGGRVLWQSSVLDTVIGEDRFDEVIAVMYPSAAAFMAFATDPEIVGALHHRREALDRASLLCCEPGAGLLD